MPKRKWVQAGVVVLLLLLCAGVLLPGVSKVRNAADRSNCQNNVKRILIALHSYNDSRGAFPPGTIPNPDLTTEQQLSWMMSIVPYVEASDLYSRTNISAAWDAGENQSVTMSSYKVYLCPVLWDERPIVTCYIGVAGVGPDAVIQSASDPHAGSFGYNRGTKVQEITDGMETTLLFCETTTGGPWAQGGPGTVRGFDPAERPYLVPGRPFGSNHIAERPWLERNHLGCNVGMADGSVRFVRETIAPEVLEALATIAGKEKVPAEEW